MCHGACSAIFSKRGYIELKEKIILWGTGQVGGKAFDNLNEIYDIVIWGDNNSEKQGLIYRGRYVLGLREIQEKYNNIEIVIALYNYYEQAAYLANCGLPVKGYYDAELCSIMPWQIKTWDNLGDKHLKLYAGDLVSSRRSQFPDDMVCLSLNRPNFYTIHHDIVNPYPLPDNSVDFYQSEDVFEHIDQQYFIPVLNEIYRVLSPEGWLRVSLPDYNCPIIIDRSFRRPNGEIVFDPGGGGTFSNGKVIEGGHNWFPTIDVVIDLLKKTKFDDFEFLCYHDKNGVKFRKNIDHSKGYILRTQEHGQSDICIIFDAFKSKK